MVAGELLVVRRDCLSNSAAATGVIGDVCAGSVGLGTGTEDIAGIKLFLALFDPDAVEEEEDFEGVAG